MGPQVRWRISRGVRASHGAGDGERFRVDPSGHAARGESCQHRLGGNITDKPVARERASAKSSERTIEPPASCFIRRENLFSGALGTTVQMNSDFDARDAVLHGTVQMRDIFRRCGTDRVGERNGSDADVLQPHERIFDDFRSPRLFVGIAKSHRNVHDKISSRGFGFALEFFDELARLHAGHIRVGAPKIRGNRIRVANRGHTGRCQGAVEALGIHDYANNLRRFARG